jgi:DNA polymerase-4
LEFLATLPVSAIWGVGKAMQATLARDGIRQIAQLQQIDEAALARRYDATGLRLARLARGIDNRKVIPRAAAKSISSETTFNQDTGDAAILEKHLWRLSERTAEHCKAKNVAGKTIVLKMKADRLSSITRNRALPDPTQLADVIFTIGKKMMQQVLADKPNTKFRLIGIGVAGLVDELLADPLDLADPDKGKRKAAEQALDSLRDKFGKDSIKKGRSL